MSWLVEEQDVSKCWRFDHKMGKVYSVLRFQKQKGVDLLSWVDLWLLATRSWTASRWKNETALSNEWTLICNCQIAYYYQLWNLSSSPYTYSWRFRNPMEAKLSKTYPQQEERAGKYFVTWKWQKQVFRLSIWCELSIVWILTLCWPIWGVSEWTQQPCLQHLGWWMNNPLLQGTLQHVTERQLSPANHVHKDVDLCLPKQAGHSVAIIITTMIIFNR